MRNVSHFLSLTVYNEYVYSSQRQNTNQIKYGIQIQNNKVSKNKKYTQVYKKVNIIYIICIIICREENT